MDSAVTTYDEQLLTLIDQRADQRIAAYAAGAAQLSGASGGTVVQRTGRTTCLITLDGSALAVPVKVFGDVEIMEGDRVGVVRIGLDWTVVGTFTRRRSITMPDETDTGEQRMVWGADTPVELQTYGLTVAMIAYTIDFVTGLEVGYFFMAVSNQMDGANARALVFGNVSYPTPGNPATATAANVKTNFQMDMFAQFPFTIFKDQTVLDFPGVNRQIDQGSGAVTQGKGPIARVDSATLNVSDNTNEFTLLTVPSMVYRNGRTYYVRWQFRTQTVGGANNQAGISLRKGTGTGGTLLGSNFIATYTQINNFNPETRHGGVYLKNVSGSDVTTALTITAIAQISIHVQVTATAAAVAYLEVYDAGDTTTPSYANTTTIS